MNGFLIQFTFSHFYFVFLINLTGLPVYLISQNVEDEEKYSTLIVERHLKP